MKSIVKIAMMLILLGIIMEACSNYVCPAYRAKIENPSQAVKHS
jgi:hypothetical protein